MEQTAVVTGANGHLGNNLVRILRSNGIRVSAGIRDIAKGDFLRELGASPVKINLLDKDSLLTAFQGHDVLYQVGAVFKHWSRNPHRDIYRTNMTATRNVLEAAHESGIRKIVYVSSLAAVDRGQNPIQPTTWNKERNNVYFQSKTDSEKLAWELVEKFGLKMVSVLPGAMIGPNDFSRTPTMSMFHSILAGKLNVNPGFYFNFVDVRDVAQACYKASIKGNPGNRYLLANEKCTGIDELISIAQQMFPDLRIKTPSKLPRSILYLAASIMELIALATQKEPLLQRNYLKAFSVQEYCDISKSKSELDFNPRLPEEVIRDTFHLVYETQHKV
jgi:dihydroflavonol-4-reductase